MSSPEDRFERIARELRASKPAAPPGLRERVAALRPELRKKWLPRVAPPRRAVLVLASACVVAGAGAALVHGLVAGGTRPAKRAQASAPAAKPLAAPSVGHPLQEFRSSIPAGRGTLAAGLRLERHDVRLRVRVRDVANLSDATAAAMGTTRRLGGYIASANFSEPTRRRGVSSLVVMIPVDRLQQAIQRFSKLGTIVAQHIAIKDLQRQVDEESTVLTRLERQIRRVRSALGGSLPGAKRAALERTLARAQRKLHALGATRTATIRRASFARVSLTLVTKKTATAAPGRFERTVRDATSVLLSELGVLLYALFVVGPLALLGALGFATARAARRHGDERLLGT